MAFFMCMVAICPIRSEPSHRSEQISQLLFGEMCELLERGEDFLRIRVSYDNYEGWCQSTQLEETEFEMSPKNNRLAGEWINKLSINNTLINIPFGSLLDFLDEKKAITEKHNIIYKGVSVYPAKNTMSPALVKKISFTFLNTSYLWGGRSVFGIDCSGFTQLVFKCMDIPLLRDAYQQATQGKAIEFSESTCGDVAFFTNATGKITHVGILLDANTIIHASGKVRIDTIDNLGIINNDTGKRTHHLSIVKRLSNN